MALKKLDIMKTREWDNYDHYLIATDENDDVLAGYAYDSIKDVEEAINDLGWYKNFDSLMLLDATGYKSIAEIAEAVGRHNTTIFANKKDDRSIQCIHKCDRGNLDKYQTSESLKKFVNLSLEKGYNLNAYQTNKE